MKIIKVDDPSAIRLSLDVLKSGGVIIYPTDTLYGFGADATNESAISKINHLKNRTGPMSVMAADKSMAINWLNLNINEIQMIKPYLGGAKTIIAVVKSGIVCDKIVGQNNSLGIRIPDNQFCNELSRQFGQPITSTSVNLRDEQPLNNPTLIAKQFGATVDLIIDSGTLLNTQGSTIYRFNTNKITILRQ